jgi:hypothetical protein
MFFNASERIGDNVIDELLWVLFGNDWLLIGLSSPVKVSKGCWEGFVF